jgi:ribosomal protein L37AE/L43A
MNEILSQIIADLFEKSKEGEDPSSKINRLRDELKKVIEGDDTIFGKFRELMVSFEIIIPDEKQRYNVAIKALSTTSKLSRQEIIQAVNKQREELKILKKVLMPAQPDWRDELRVMEAKSREMRDEISKLREAIGRLESEEKGILNGMATREKEMERVEKAVEKLFTDIGEEIASIKKGIEEFTAENAAPPPIPPAGSVKSYTSTEEKGSGGQKSEILGSSGPQNTEWQKKCPMCGGRMNFQAPDNMWICYSCAYEELKKDAVQDKRETVESSGPQDMEWQKKCPMCGGQMNFLIHEGKWQCYTCAYEELKKDDVQGKSEEHNEHANPPQLDSDAIFDPFPSLVSYENQETKKGSPLAKNQPSPKKKTCPSCRKKMQWHQMENAWRCPYCDYERRI